jgi:2-methylisocitrate lyase-like PEP mutase family enzyme
LGVKRTNSIVREVKKFTFSIHKLRIKHRATDSAIDLVILFSFYLQVQSQTKRYTMENYEIFRNLHHKDKPLILGNAWDIQSAKILQKTGYPAVATSSAALARSAGYDDGEKIPFSELLFTVEKMVAAIPVPLSVDLEKGYSKDIFKIIDNISALADVGAVGINIEDSVSTPTGRELGSADEFAKKISTIKNHLEKSNRKIFINARTDAYVLKLVGSLDISIQRAKSYNESGADGIFVPFVNKAEDIHAIVSAIRLPLNVVSMAELPDYETLSSLGVKRISMGSAIFNNTYSYFEKLVTRINSEKSIALLF